MSITLNPGFAVLIAAALAMMLKRAMRAPAMVAGGLAALFLIYEPSFGAGGAFAQIGLTITPLRLDPLSQIFGTGFALMTIILALFSAARDDAVEDVALMAHAGGAMAAVFAGDMVSFVAGAQFAAMAGAVLVFRGPNKGALEPGALGAGVRYLSWHAIGGALMAAGVGLAWARTHAISFDQLSPRETEGALIFIGLLIIAGAPLAHVWVKDALQRTSAAGGAALATFLVKLGAYGLARAFSGEPTLLYLGAIAALGAVVMAALSQDVRQASGYGIVSQSGAAMAAVGAGTPLALASATSLSFASMLQGGLALLALGLACERAGTARVSALALGGLARTMPITALLALLAAASVMGVPGLIGFVATSLHIDALAQQDRPLLWLALVAATAGGVLHLGGRLPYVVFFGAERGARGREASFPAQLAMGLAAFFCIAIGAMPGWLYALLPDRIFFRPYDWDHVVRQAELASFAWAALALAATLKLFPHANGKDVADVDWLLRSGAKPALLRLGAGVGQVLAFANVQAGAAITWVRKPLAILAREGDRPAAPDAAGLVWTMVILVIAMVFLFAFQA